MKPSVALTIFLLISAHVNGQEYFNAGTKAIENSEFKKADSLLSISIEKSESPQAHFNRAIARLALNDLEGSCSDFHIMSEVLRDEESIKLYNLHCCNNVDTVYYNSKYEVANSDKYRYYSIRRIHRFSDDTTTTYHSKNAKYSHITAFGNGPGTSFITTYDDMYANSYLLNGKEIFSKCHRIYVESVSYSKLEEFKIEAADKIIALYPQLKSNKINSELQLLVKLLMNQEGEIVQVINYKLLREFDVSLRCNTYCKNHKYSRIRATPKISRVLLILVRFFLTF